MKMNKKGMIKFISLWNTKYPYDKLWRNKHGIPLFSEKHKEMKLFDILMEIEEDRLYQEAIEDIHEQKLRDENPDYYLIDRSYVSGRNNWLKSTLDSLSEEEEEALFDNIKI